MALLRIDSVTDVKIFKLLFCYQYGSCDKRFCKNRKKIHEQKL
jgi:hypothetical protein